MAPPDPFVNMGAECCKSQDDVNLQPDGSKSGREQQPPKATEPYAAPEPPQETPEAVQDPVSEQSHSSSGAAGLPRESLSETIVTVIVKFPPEGWFPGNPFVTDANDGLGSIPVVAMTSA